MIKNYLAQKGQVGITLNAGWGEASTEADSEAASLFMDFELGFWAKPIFIDGNYPPKMIEGKFRLHKYSMIAQFIQY